MSVTVFGRRVHAEGPRSLLLALAVVLGIGLGVVALATLASNGKGSTSPSQAPRAGNVESRWLPRPLTYLLVSSDQERRNIESVFNEDRGGVKVPGPAPEGEIRVFVVSSPADEAAAFAEIRLMKLTSGWDDIRVIDTR